VRSDGRMAARPSSRNSARPGERFQQVEAVLETWRIDDEWWRRPISRIYHEVVLETGATMVIYQDLEVGREEGGKRGGKREEKKETGTCTGRSSGVAEEAEKPLASFGPGLEMEGSAQNTHPSTMTRRKYPEAP